MHIIFFEAIVAHPTLRRRCVGNYHSSLKKENPAHRPHSAAQFINNTKLLVSLKPSPRMFQTIIYDQTTLLNIISRTDALMWSAGRGCSEQCPLT